MSTVVESVTPEGHTPITVMVTGGAGFIGSYVAGILLSRGDRVVIVDEMNDYYDVRQKQANLQLLRSQYPSQLVIFRGDICDVDFISDVFEKERPSHVCHLAARAGVRPSIVDPYIYVHSNIEGTTRLLDLARQYSCKNFVYASSSSVYGCSTNEILSENDVVEKPVSPYAATKKACELLAYTFHHLYGLNCTGLRFFTVYGPRGRPDMAPFKFIDRVYNGYPIQQYGDGSTSRDYTYIDDIAAGVIAAVDRPLGCEVINLGNGRPFLLKDFISLVEKSVGKKAVIEVLPCQPGDVDRTCADISKARALLDYSPRVPFEEGIRRTAEWYASAAAQGLFDAEDEDDPASMDSSSGADSEQDPSSEEDEEEEEIKNAVAPSGKAKGGAGDALVVTQKGTGVKGMGKEDVAAALEREIEEEMLGVAIDIEEPNETEIEQSSGKGPYPAEEQSIRHSRHSRSGTRNRKSRDHGHGHGHGEHGRIGTRHRQGSDLELSSYVEPAPQQVTQRARRFFGLF